jgi:hypothetical protein
MKLQKPMPHTIPSRIYNVTLNTYNGREKVCAMYFSSFVFKILPPAIPTW